jgi:hypothetical protein
MPWDWQLAATLALVGLAAAYIARTTWKTWTGKKSGCGSGCGKCTTPEPPEEMGRISLPQA